MWVMQVPVDGMIEIEEVEGPDGTGRFPIGSGYARVQMLTDGRQFGVANFEVSQLERNVRAERAFHLMTGAHMLLRGPVTFTDLEFDTVQAVLEELS